MRPTATRLLSLLSLLQMHRSWPGSELAERLEVDVRTVRRDVGRLRELGYPVSASSGKGGAYQLGAGTTLPPLLFADDEAVAVAVGLLLSVHGAVAGGEAAAVRAFAKLDTLLPARLRKRARALQEATVALSPPGEPAVSAALLSLVASACAGHETLCFRYPDREGALQPRRVEPHRLACTGRRWYLMAWDTERQDWRTFRVDRLARASLPGARFVPRKPPREAADFVSQSIASGPYRHQARILMHAPAEAVAARTSPAAGRVEPRSARTCVLHTGADSLDTLALYVALKGFDFEVLAPPELIAHVRLLGERCARAAR